MHLLSVPQPLNLCADTTACEFHIVAHRQALAPNVALCAILSGYVARVTRQIERQHIAPGPRGTGIPLFLDICEFDDSDGSKL
jgi:hypothetical protein